MRSHKRHIIDFFGRKNREFSLCLRFYFQLLYFRSKCQRVPAMRCKIEKRTVVKTKPESKCSRVPREYCRKEECEEDQVPLNKDDPNCYYRNQVVS